MLVLCINELLILMFEILTKRLLTTSLVLNNWALIDKRSPVSNSQCPVNKGSGLTTLQWENFISLQVQCQWSMINNQCNIFCCFELNKYILCISLLAI